jgi:hypothetical protein
MSGTRIALNGNAPARTNGSVDHERPDVHRKTSSPLMPPYMVSAPGKVIVYGEHAVVHGKVSLYPPEAFQISNVSLRRLPLPLPSRSDRIF